MLAVAVVVEIGRVISLAKLHKVIRYICNISTSSGKKERHSDCTSVVNVSEHTLTRDGACPA